MKESKDKLGDRMKSYENEARHYLDPKKPVIIRLDGKAFHTFTRGFKKPFDEILIESMQETMRELCTKIQNTVFGYTQSDEITLVLLANRNENTAQWFDGNIQKMCSVAASIATWTFNRVFESKVENFAKNLDSYSAKEEEFTLLNKYRKAVETGGFFDARAFNVSEDEVINCVIWRQFDAQRNSKQMVAQHFFTQKELHGKNCDILVRELEEFKGVKWVDLPAYKRHGSACVKKHVVINKGLPTEAMRNRWFVDIDMPFLVDDKEYLGNALNYIFETVEE